MLGDFCSGRIWTLRAGADVADASSSIATRRRLITSFGEAENGELYMTDHAGGGCYRVVAPPYSDVTNHSLIDHIMWITYADISTGCGGGKYCPNDSVTRAQMAAFLDRALDLPATDEDFFTDDNNDPLEISINRVAAAGIASGCATNRYCPSNPVTRGQMASFLDRAFDLPSTSNDYFVDDEGSTHEDAINRLAHGEHHRRLHVDALLPDGLDDPRRDGRLPAPGRRRLMCRGSPHALASADRRVRSRSSSSAALLGSPRVEPARAGGEVLPGPGDGAARGLPDPVGQRPAPAALHRDDGQRRRRPFRGPRQPRQRPASR